MCSFETGASVIEYQQLASLSSSISFTESTGRATTSKLISHNVIFHKRQARWNNRGHRSYLLEREVVEARSTRIDSTFGALFSDGIFINNYAARLREGRRGMLYCERPRISSVCASSITIFRYPIHFTLCWAKQRASGWEFVLARARAEPDDRDALLSKLHLPCALSHTNACLYEHDGANNLNRRQSSRENLSRDNDSDIHHYVECKRKSW